MSRKRRVVHSAAFKAKVALAALKETRPLSELAGLDETEGDEAILGQLSFQIDQEVLASIWTR